MDNIYDLQYYVLAKRMLKEIPLILDQIDTFHAELAKYPNHHSIADVQNSLFIAKIELQSTYRYYRQLYNRKGKNE
jgi:hypothetical protein